MSNRLMNFFFDSDLRSGHTGLTKVAKKNRINTDSLQPGEFVIFINKALSAFKLYGSNNTLVYYRSPRGRIDLNTIQFLPQVFNAGQLNYSKALELAFHKRRGTKYVPVIKQNQGSELHS